MQLRTPLVFTAKKLQISIKINWKMPYCKGHKNLLFTEGFQEKTITDLFPDHNPVS